MFALVEDGSVVMVFRSIPECFANVSGFNLLTDAERAAYGFYPMNEGRPPLKAGEKLGATSDAVVDGVLVRTYAKTKKSADELATDLENSKNSAFQRIDSGYISELGANIEYLGTTFQADDASRQIMSDSIAAAGGAVPAGFGWYDVTNTKVPMTFAELQGMANAIFLRGQIAFDKRQAKKAEIRNAKIAADADAINW